MPRLWVRDRLEIARYTGAGKKGGYDGGRRRLGLAEFPDFDGHEIGREKAESVWACSRKFGKCD